MCAVWGRNSAVARRQFARSGGCFAWAAAVMLANMSQHAEMPPLTWSELGVSELLPTGTVTLLLADVEGSTRLWESQPEQMTAALAALNRTVDETVAAYGGV